MFQSRFNTLAKSFKTTQYTLRKELINEMEAFSFFKKVLFQRQKERGVVYVIGNGGSAGIASHFSVDLMKALKIPSMTFFDSNLMTCLSNDLGYEKVFSLPLKRVAKPQDALVAISSSGNSENILKAVEMAKRLGMPVVTLSGFSENNPLRSMGDLNIWIDRSDYGLVEMGHFCLLHCLVDLCRSELHHLREYAETIGTSSAT